MSGPGLEPREWFLFCFLFSFLLSAQAGLVWEKRLRQHSTGLAPVQMKDVYYQSS